MVRKFGLQITPKPHDFKMDVSFTIELEEII